MADGADFERFKKNLKFSCQKITNFLHFRHNFTFVRVEKPLKQFLHDTKTV